MTVLSIFIQNTHIESFGHQITCLKISLKLGFLSFLHWNSSPLFQKAVHWMRQEQHKRHIKSICAYRSICKVSVSSLISISILLSVYSEVVQICVQYFWNSQHLLSRFHRSRGLAQKPCYVYVFVAMKCTGPWYCQIPDRSEMFIHGLLFQSGNSLCFTTMSGLHVLI